MARKITSYLQHHGKVTVELLQLLEEQDPSVKHSSVKCSFYSSTTFSLLWFLVIEELGLTNSMIILSTCSLSGRDTKHITLPHAIMH
jgi:hypothetical protein